MSEERDQEVPEVPGDWQAVAQRAGLAIALRDFPGDVLAAAQAAAQVRRAFVVPASATAEPWPPMRLPHG